MWSVRDVNVGSVWDLKCMTSGGIWGCRGVRSRSMWDLVGVSAPIGCCGVFGMWDLGGM